MRASLVVESELKTKHDLKKGLLKGLLRGPRGPGGRQGASKRQLLEALKWRPEAQNRGSRRGAVHISGKPS